MPLYEYQCDACGHRFEVIQKYSDPPIAVCPSCGGAVTKLFSSPAIQFKGSGFYLTDYGRGGKPDAGKPSGGGDTSGATASGSAEKKGEGSSESKSEAKTESKGDASGSSKSDTAPAKKSEPASSSSTTKPGGSGPATA